MLSLHRAWNNSRISQRAFILLETVPLWMKHQWQMWPGWGWGRRDGGVLTWKTLGALTSDASAEERVAEKIPAEIRGAKPDTKLITCVTHAQVRMLAAPWCRCCARLTVGNRGATAQQAQLNYLIKSRKHVKVTGPRRQHLLKSRQPTAGAVKRRRSVPTGVTGRLPACKRTRNTQMLDLCTSVCLRQTG